MQPSNNKELAPHLFVLPVWLTHSGRLADLKNPFSYVHTPELEQILLFQCLVFSFSFSVNLCNRFKNRITPEVSWYLLGT